MHHGVFERDVSVDLAFAVRKRTDDAARRDRDVLAFRRLRRAEETHVSIGFRGGFPLEAHLIAVQIKPVSSGEQWHGLCQQRFE